MTNPLLENRRLPAFSDIKPEHVEPAIDKLLAESRAAIAALLADPDARDWKRLIEPLEAIDERLSRAWSPVSHLNSVRNEPALREAYNACLPKLTDYHSETGQNEALFRAIERVAESASDLGKAERKLLEHTLRDFRLSGVALGTEEKEEFRALARRRSKLQAKFEENVLDATNAWSRHVTDESELSGLPERSKQRAHEAARKKDMDGWLITLDYPSYEAIITYADNRALRRELYEAWVTRAAELGPHDKALDNSAVMTEILALRQRSARLLGFPDYAALSLAPKMAKDPQEVLDFLGKLIKHTRRAGKKEFDNLAAFARERFGHKELRAWDITYFSEKLRREKYGISDEVLRPYFPLPVVLDGLFRIAGRLYGIEVRAREDVDVYHEDVAFFDVVDHEGRLRGSFFTDLFARPNKRGGAWMDDCATRVRMSGIRQDPVAYLVGNFMPPVGEGPALLTHNELLTLFHEFGHTLHHVLTRADYPSVAGINNVPWDAVELPSQFMENFAFEHDALPMISGHYETGEPLPGELLEKLRGARTFHSAMHMLRQLEFALFDFRLHIEFSGDDSGQVLRLLDEVRAQVAVVPTPEFNRFPNSFSHIFSGGYAAGYYSYKWAEVLSADAFSAFEKEGIFNPDTGRRFLDSVLAVGGTRDAMEAFVEFRGREPKIGPLLRHAGISSGNEELQASG